ncbi:MAG TPA: DUF916 domain-containing protein [Acidimicrobiales bacterium]|nr:DUF916 domain-containing protein [Acidimicrobiales bacterium]
MKRRRRLALAVAAAFAIGITASPVHAAAGRDPIDEPIGSDTVVNAWAVAPVGPSVDPTQPSERPFLTYSVTPGQVIHDEVVLYNYSNVPLDFRLYPTDAFNNEQGAFDALPANQKAKDVGTWVKVDQENLALPAKTQAVVPITLTVPRQAAPGDHAGAILASSIAQGTGPNGQVVNVDRRTGTRIYVRVAGKLTPQLTVTKVTNTYKPSLNPFAGKAVVSYRVENQGNVRLAGKHHVSASGLLGIGKKSTKQADVPELLPGQGVTLHATFSGMPATFLDFATAKVDPDDVLTQHLGVTSRSAATLAVPWSVIALATIVALSLYARRSYRRRTAGE